jgi:uncharacterized protein YegP (UPF0339 family)
MEPIDEIEVFRGHAGDWYWRRVAPNGRIITVGGEPFARKWTARRAARRANRDLNWTWTP